MKLIAMVYTLFASLLVYRYWRGNADAIEAVNRGFTSTIYTLTGRDSNGRPPDFWGKVMPPSSQGGLLPYPGQVINCHGRRVVARIGDTLPSIANRFGLTVEELLEINPGLEEKLLASAGIAQEGPPDIRVAYAKTFDATGRAVERDC